MSNVNPLTGTVTDNLNAAWSYIVGQCTRFVAGALSWIPAGLGNAKDWFANAQAKGLPTIGPTLAPPIGSVAVWGAGLPGSGGFGHVAEVIGQVPGGFQVAEENFSGGPGNTDVRTVSDLSNVIGFIVPPVGAAQAGAATGQAIGAGGVPGGVGDLGSAIAGLPASVGHGLANALGATVQDTSTFLQRQLIALVVALVVVLVLFVR